ncbi:MAG: gamma-glutamyltransferase, partial [Rhodospirillales bacterium]
PDSPMASMMTPCILQGPDGQLVALGSGGSNRIRTAILQLIRNIAGRGMDLPAAVAAPRLHVEEGRIDIEPGFTTAERAQLRDTGLALHEWPEPSLFFGGTQVAGLTQAGFEAAGDPRRDGDARVC